jgi:hypothetical protein
MVHTLEETVTSTLEGPVEGQSTNYRIISRQAIFQIEKRSSKEKTIIYHSNAEGKKERKGKGDASDINTMDQQQMTNYANQEITMLSRVRDDGGREEETMKQTWD